jgi:hypothetical protein
MRNKILSQLKMTSFLIAASVLFCMNYCEAAGGKLTKNALVHFDASHSESIIRNDSGMVESWRSLNSKAEFKAAAEESLPGYFEIAQDLAIVRFDGSNDFLRFNSTEKFSVKYGSLHIFIVAQTANNCTNQSILSVAEGYPRLNLFSNGDNYKIETGDFNHHRRIAEAVDGKMHLFELSHVVLPSSREMSTRTIWPGDYYMDGKLCGKLFIEEVEMTLDNMVIGADISADKNFLKGNIGEIIIFDKPLSKKQVREIRHDLARKWNVTLNEWSLPEDLPKMEEKRVGPEGRHSSFGYYGSSPESPDGTRIAYIVFDEFLDDQNTSSKYGIWVCDKDLTNHRKIMDSPIEAGMHNGAIVQWVDNDRIAFGSDRRGDVYIIDSRSGEVDLGPYSPAWPGAVSNGGKILLHVSGKSEFGTNGIYELDTKSGEITEIFTSEDFDRYFKEYKWSGSPDTSQWRFVHGKYSQDETHIAFTVVPGRGGKQHLFTARADGSDLRVWGCLEVDTGSDKPLHFMWYSDDLIYGIDQGTQDGTANDLLTKLWDRDGNYVSTIAGVGNHLGMSFDKNWIAGDTFYFDDPVRLYMYKYGDTKPAAVVFEHKGITPTWLYHGHVNPSFSRDSKRVYYNRPVEDKFVQAYYCEFYDQLKK